MHWIQTIREYLELSNEELAHYLGLSVHTIKSVEHERRQLPLDSLRAAITLFNAIKDCRTRGLENEPLIMADLAIHRTKRFHRQCCRRLNQYTHKLKKMQEAYTRARRRLGAYQFLAQALTPAHSKDDLSRLQWTKQKIREATQHLEDNNITAQQLLTAEIANLKSMVLALEEDQRNHMGVL